MSFLTKLAAASRIKKLAKLAGLRSDTDRGKHYKTAEQLHNQPPATEPHVFIQVGYPIVTSQDDSHSTDHSSDSNIQHPPSPSPGQQPAVCQPDAECNHPGSDVPATRDSTPRLVRCEPSTTENAQKPSMPPSPFFTSTPSNYDTRSTVDTVLAANYDTRSTVDTVLAANYDTRSTVPAATSTRTYPVVHCGSNDEPSALHPAPTHPSPADYFSWGVVPSNPFSFMDAFTACGPKKEKKSNVETRELQKASKAAEKASRRAAKVAEQEKYERRAVLVGCGPMMAAGMMGGYVVPEAFCEYVDWRC